MSAREKERSALNRTLVLSAEDRIRLRGKLARLGDTRPDPYMDGVFHADMMDIVCQLPAHCADLIVLDPPYNLDKSFGSEAFRKRSSEEYAQWILTWLPSLLRTLKPTGSLYFCGDWRSSSAIEAACEGRLIVRNRITWEREKGRGASANWKNASEDIWFFTASNEYFFDVEAVKLKKRIIAPYTDQSGKPKGWEDGYRLTHPSNLWTDLTVPFWSMPENTDHPTQKPEKLIAKLILASSRPGEVVLDPFLGSGTSAVVSSKLGRRFVGIEIEEEFALLALRRLEAAECDRSIQGYSEGTFWERNSAPAQTKKSSNHRDGGLFQ
ncbi:MAG: site-specific DNA-methyltransferase [Fimbriimonadaceae bacterium]|nr:site-specific DNA-methyltransferase [Fimbriimonadaceae bacterium]